MASRMSGDRRLRRTLRRVEPSTGKRVSAAIDRTAQSIESDMVRLVPKNEGDLARSIATKRGRDGLTSVIGPGAKSVSISKSPFRQAALGINAKTKHWRYFQFFKGYWLEFGTSKMPPKPFSQPAFDLNKAFGLKQIRAAIRVSLRDASSGRTR